VMSQYDIFLKARADILAAGAEAIPSQTTPEATLHSTQ